MTFRVIRKITDGIVAAKFVSLCRHPFKTRILALPPSDKFVPMPPVKSPKPPMAIKQELAPDICGESVFRMLAWVQAQGFAWSLDSMGSAGCAARARLVNGGSELYVQGVSGATPELAVCRLVIEVAKALRKEAREQ